MRYAKDKNGLRIEAKQAGPSRATCGGCGETVFLKCGQKIVDHWCHLPGSTCVHAGTTGPETDWHRNWKSLVPPQYREVSIRRDGKLRRADIRAKTKTVIELQHSNIDYEEVASREEFYGKNMFWMFDSDGATRRLFRVSSGKAFDRWEGMQVYECEISDRITGLYDASRSKLIDAKDEVLRVVPHVTNGQRRFLVCVQCKSVVQNQVSATCNEEQPVVHPFLLNSAPDWAPKKMLKQMQRSLGKSTGKTMAQYCPKGFIAAREERSIGKNSWAEIWEEVKQQQQQHSVAAGEPYVMD